MPTNRRYRRRRRTTGDTLTPGLCGALSLAADLLGEFPGIEEDEVDARLGELWKVHGATVTQRWIARFPGTRPNLWWKHDAPGSGRPIVRPSDGSLSDAIRFGKERRTQDLAFLLRHDLLSRDEEAAIKEQAAELVR